MFSNKLYDKCVIKISILKDPFAEPYCTVWECTSIKCLNITWMSILTDTITTENDLDLVLFMVSSFIKNWLLTVFIVNWCQQKRYNLSTMFYKIIEQLVYRLFLFALHFHIFDNVLPFSIINGKDVSAGTFMGKSVRLNLE